MARVSAMAVERLPEDLKPLYRMFSSEIGNFSNQANVVAHSPDAFRHLYGLLAVWYQKSSIPRRLIEIAVLTTSRVNQCSYCVGHHGTAVVDLGLAAETVERILDPDVPELDEVERLVRDYARLVTERPWGIRDKVFHDLKHHFSEAQIVELTVRIALCGLFNKVNDALQIDMEESVIADMFAKNIRDNPMAGSESLRPDKEGTEPSERAAQGGLHR